MASLPFHLDHSRITIQRIEGFWPASRKVELSLLRLDQIHPEVSGNKWFKLKYNLHEAFSRGKDTVLTFGGAWSNHIAATATLCAEAGLASIGLIRGEAPTRWSQTLLQARENGMHIEFVPRIRYAACARRGSLPPGRDYGDVYIIPEGGCNALGLQGCEEILRVCPTRDYSHLCCAVGTGTTLSGLIRSAGAEQQVWGFVPMKPAAAEQLRITIALQVENSKGSLPYWRLIDDYHFGGFARKSDILLDFMKYFSDQTGISLDFVYTAKMMYGLIDQIKRGHVPQGSRLLALHTGGLQGNASLTNVPEGTFARV